MSEKTTGLYDKHVALGAKMVPFAGYVMPIQYSGILDEHMAVRSKVGVFDVSHMGEFEISGSDAQSALNFITTNNVAKLNTGDIQYTTMLYEDGGVVDDLLVYHYGDRYVTVVNAANLKKDFAWMKQNLKGDVDIKDVSDRVTLIAVQGPRATDLLKKITEVDLDSIIYYNFKPGIMAGCDVDISRTGYTGEDGFELYVDRRDSEQLWDAIFAAGEEFGVQPVGLGARDSLRLEVCYCLYGNDIDKTTNPIEAGLGWIVKSKKKGGFIGKDAVLRAKESTRRRLTGFKFLEKGIARQGSNIYYNDQIVGSVTSGGFSPVLESSIGMGYIDKPYNAIGNLINIELRGRMMQAEIIDMPFYKRQ